MNVQVPAVTDLAVLTFLGADWKIPQNRVNICWFTESRWYTDMASSGTYIRSCISRLLIAQVDKDVAFLRSSASINEPASCGHQCPWAKRGVGCAASCGLVSPGRAGTGVRVSLSVQRCEGAVHMVAGLWMTKNRNEDRLELRWWRNSKLYDQQSVGRTIFEFLTFNHLHCFLPGSPQSGHHHQRTPLSCCCCHHCGHRFVRH